MSELQALQDLKNLSGAWEERAPADINLKSLSDNLAYMSARNPLQDFTCFNNRQPFRQTVCTPRTNHKANSSSATTSINQSRRSSYILPGCSLSTSQQQQQETINYSSSVLTTKKLPSVTFPNDRPTSLSTSSESRVNSEISVSMKAAHQYDTYYLQGSNRSFYSNENINPTQKSFSTKSKVNNNLLLKLQQNNSLDPPKREYIKMLWQIKANQIGSAASSKQKNYESFIQSTHDPSSSIVVRTEPSKMEYKYNYSSIENPQSNREQQRMVPNAQIKFNQESSTSHHQTQDQLSQNLTEMEPYAQLRTKPKNRFAARAPTARQNSDDQTNTIILALPPLQPQILKPFQIPNPMNIYSAVASSCTTSSRLHSTDNQQQLQQQQSQQNNNERQQQNRSGLSVKRDLSEFQQPPTIKSKNQFPKQSQNNNQHNNTQKKYIDLSILMKQQTTSSQPEIKIQEKPNKNSNQNKEKHLDCFSNNGDQISRKADHSASDIRVKQITEILMNNTMHDSPKQLATHFKRRNSSYSSPITISKLLSRKSSVAPPEAMATKIFVKSSAKTNIQKLINAAKIHNQFSHRITKSLSDEAIAIEPPLFLQSPATAQALMSIIIAEKQPDQMRIELLQLNLQDSQDTNNKKQQERSNNQPSTQSQMPIKRKIKHSDEMAVALLSSKLTRLISKNSTKLHIHPQV